MIVGYRSVTITGFPLIAESHSLVKDLPRPSGGRSRLPNRTNRFCSSPADFGPPGDRLDDVHVRIFKHLALPVHPNAPLAGRAQWVNGHAVFAFIEELSHCRSQSPGSLGPTPVLRSSPHKLGARGSGWSSFGSRL